MSRDVEVLIVDDNARFRGRACRCLEEDGHRVVAEASDAAGALTAVERHRPAVVLLDIELPDASGLEVAKRLAAEADAPVIVLTSTHDVSDFGDALARCGARGFIAKSELSGETLSQVVGE
jgi:DNA-binding NarL/FixJ family response regulator